MTALLLLVLWQCRAFGSMIDPYYSEFSSPSFSNIVNQRAEPYVERPALHVDPTHRREFMVLDSDSSGFLDRAEMISHGLDEIFHFLDKDGDNQVTLDEYVQLHHQEQNARHHKSQHDSLPDMVYAPGEDDHLRDSGALHHSHDHRPLTYRNNRPTHAPTHRAHVVQRHHSHQPRTAPPAPVEESRVAVALPASTAKDSPNQRNSVPFASRLQSKLDKIRAFSQFHDHLYETLNASPSKDSLSIRKISFALFDTDANDQVSLSEFANGNHLEVREIQHLFDEMDVDHSNYLDLTEIFPAVRINDATALTHEPVVKETQSSEFEKFDLDGNGVLDLSELRAGKIEDLLQYADDDHDQELTLREYFRTQDPKYALIHQKRDYLSMDDDGDGRVNRLEFARHIPPQAGESLDQHIAAADKNNDGWLSFVEVFPGTTEPNWKPEPGHLEENDAQAKKVKTIDTPTSLYYENKQLFASIDLNGDGRVNMEEYVQAIPPDSHEISEEAHFQSTDKDGDGWLSFAEIFPNTPSPQKEKFESPTDQFDHMDHNGDSFIDIREYYQRYGKLKTEEHFDHLDKNQDGKLTHEEMHGYQRPGTQLPGVISID